VTAPRGDCALIVDVWLNEPTTLMFVHANGEVVRDAIDVGGVHDLAAAIVAIVRSRGDVSRVVVDATGVGLALLQQLQLDAALECPVERMRAA
jgi:hypothetical protein